jgi:hypothetical protein
MYCSSPTTRSFPSAFENTSPQGLRYVQHTRASQRAHKNHKALAPAKCPCLILLVSRMRGRRWGGVQSTITGEVFLFLFFQTQVQFMDQKDSSADCPHEQAVACFELDVSTLSGEMERHVE